MSSLRFALNTNPLSPKVRVVVSSIRDAALTVAALLDIASRML
jgi:hypothetical protein